MAYAVYAALGIDSGDYRLGYVSTWAGGGAEAIAAIRAAGSRVQKTADDILTRIDGATEDGVTEEWDAVA